VLLLELLVRHLQVMELLSLKCSRVLHQLINQDKAQLLLQMHHLLERTNHHRLLQLVLILLTDFLQEFLLSMLTQLSLQDILLEFLHHRLHQLNLQILRTEKTVLKTEKS
jgi:hypothetical protein